jgi:hypothetical protein
MLVVRPCSLLRHHISHPRGYTYGHKTGGMLDTVPMYSQNSVRSDASRD